MKKPEFFVLLKSFNSTLEKYDILKNLFLNIEENKKNKAFTIFDDASNKIIPIAKKEHLIKYVKTYFKCRYWSRCEYEFVIVDWPYKEKVEDSFPVKIDAYEQIELNFDVIMDLIWKYEQATDNTRYSW